MLNFSEPFIYILKVISGQFYGIEYRPKARSFPKRETCAYD